MEQTATRGHFGRSWFLPSIIGCEGGRVCSSTAASRTAFFGSSSADCPVTCCFPTERSVAPVNRVIDLHLWNEQIPVKPIAGYSLAWGCRFNRSLAKSLRGLAQFLMNKPQLSDINIVRAVTNLDPLHRIARRHGFEVICEPVNPSPWEHVHRFGQNILYWLLTLACHSGRMWPRKFSRSRRVIYLSRRVLDRKYIAATRRHNQPTCIGEQQNNLLRPQEKAPSTV